jgi:hypothetical protein
MLEFPNWIYHAICYSSIMRKLKTVELDPGTLSRAELSMDDLDYLRRAHRLVTTVSLTES